MALKVLLLRKQIDNRRKALEGLLAKRTENQRRESELAKAIDEVETEEQRAEVEGMVSEFEAKRDQSERDIKDLQDEITGLEAELAEVEAKQETDPPVRDAHAPEISRQRSENTMVNRVNVANVTLRERIAAISTRDDVRDFSVRMRGMIGQKRAVNGAEVAIPETLLPMIREVVDQNSKLLRYVNLEHVRGTTRKRIMGSIPEAIWTEMCGKLNELDLDLNDTEMDGYKVGAFMAIDNATKEDNDVELVMQIIHALGVAEAKAVDKAIAYGKGVKMPLGIVTRLLEATEPSNARDTDRKWEDLHEKNVIKITAANSTGIKLFQGLIKAFGAAKKKYNADGKFWAMNENTRAKVVAEALSINSAGAIVSGVNSSMPVIGGDIVELDFIPDDVIVAGYGANYLMAERAVRVIGQSEEVRFIEDQTVFKSTARYDGAPVIPESFIVIGINGADVTADVSFAADKANQTADKASSDEN